VTSTDHDLPLTLPEGMAAAALASAGLVASAVGRVYSAGTWPLAVCLTSLSVIASILLFMLSLRALRIPPGRRLAGAVWATLPSNVFLLSQMAYVGFFFIPLEILASALILRIRAHLPRWWVALGLAAAVRIATLGLVYGARPALRGVFPWR
jgi:hypothetical protein